MSPNNQYLEATDTTSVKTLWTLTMMEVLYDDLINDRPDQSVQSAVKELYAKNVKPSYLVRKVARELGGVYSVRLKHLIQQKQ